MQIEFKKYCYRDVMQCRVVKMYQILGAKGLHLQCRSSEDGSWWFLEAEVKTPANVTAAKTEECGPSCLNHRCENLKSH